MCLEAGVIYAIALPSTPGIMCVLICMYIYIYIYIYMFVYMYICIDVP